MAQKPRIPKKKLPKAPLGQRIKQEVRSSMAKGLSKNFGALGTAVAKRFIAAPKTSRRRVPDPGKANQKDIPKKNIKKDAPIVDSILESAKQVASTIDIVALNAGRSFAVATRQTQIMGDEISTNLRDLNNILDRMLYKGPQPPPLPQENKSPQTTNPSSKEEEGTGFSIPDLVKIGAGSFTGRVLGSIVKGAGTGTAIIGTYEALKGMKSDSQTGNHMRTWLRGLLGIEDPGEAAPWSGAMSNKEYQDALKNKNSTPVERVPDKVDIGKDKTMFKLTYKADKISFKSDNNIKFKSRVDTSRISYLGGLFSLPRSMSQLPKSMSQLPESMSGSNFLSRWFGGGSSSTGKNTSNEITTESRSKNISGGSNDNVSKPDIQYQGPESGAYDSTKAHANYMQPGPEFGQPGENLTTVTTEGGHKFQVNSASADAFKRFIESAEKEGMPLGSIGGYSPRPGGIAGTGRMSQHSMGNAMDIGSQTARDVISPKTREWIETHPNQFRKMLDDSGMISGGDWKNPDLGHIEWSGRKPWMENKQAVEPTQKDNAGLSPAQKAFDGFVGDGRDDSQSSGFDFERWKWMHPKNPKDIEDRTGEEDSEQWNTMSARGAAQIRAIAGTRWMAEQSLPASTPMSTLLGSQNLDYALIANSRKDIRQSLGLPDPKGIKKQRIYDDGGVNNDKTKTNQGVNTDDLDHRPRREAVPSEKFDDYMGTTSGREDAD